MDASQKFLEEIEFLIQDDVSHYEYEDDVAEALSVALNNMITGLIALIEKQEPVFVHQPLENWQKTNK